LLAFTSRDGAERESPQWGADGGASTRPADPCCLSGSPVLFSPAAAPLSHSAVSLSSQTQRALLLSPCDTKACHTNKNLAIYVSRDFFTQTNQKSQEKNLKIFGGHLTKIFARLISRYLFLDIYFLSYTAVNLKIFSLKKSRDFLFFFAA